MKFKFFLLLFFILLINLMNVKAEIANVNFGKENYSELETLQAEINFNVNLLNVLNVLNFELLDKNNKKTPVGYFLTKLNNKQYYLYFNLPNLISDNYTLKIKDISYIDENNILRKESKEFKFSVMNKDFIIQTDPAILKVDNPNDFPEFNIKIKNLSNLTNITIKTEDEFIKLLNTFSSINKNEIKNFKIIIDSNNLNSINKGNIDIIYNDESYKIPIYLIRDLQDTSEIIIPKDAIRFIEDNNIINKTLYIDESIEGSLKFKNFFNETISNLNFGLTNNLNEIIDLELIHNISIGENETKEQYLIINKDRNANAKIYSGDLVLKNEDIIILFPIYLNFKEREVIQEKIKENITIDKKENKTTSLFEETQAETEEKKESSKKTFITVLIVIIIILIALGSGAYFKRKKVIKQSFSEFAESFEKKK